MRTPEALVALAQYREKFWFPSGALAANIPGRVFLYDNNVFATLYTDATGTTELPNPLRTDAEGYLTFWAEEGTYWLHIDTESFEIFVGGSGEEATEGWVLQQIAVHNADTTDVHGIPNTADLVTTADLAGYATDAELAAHEADTTNVHGIPNTATLETQAGAQARADQAEADAIAAAGIDATAKANEAQANAEETAANALAGHEADTTNVHGIADTSALLTEADLSGYATDAELAAHAADTTAVHGIANTADLATDADVAAVASSLAGHVADTTGVHGIADTSQLLTSADLEDYATDAELAAHAADTTAVHGIADTSQLVTDADLAGYATDAELALVQADIDAHEADTTNVHGITDTSTLVTDADLAGYATQAELTAVQDNLSDHVDATTDVHGIADTSALLTDADIANLATDAELAAVQAELDAHEADTTDVHGIPDTSVLVTDADLAGLATDAELADLQGELDAHTGATTSVHGIGDTAELETQTGAQDKADAAQAAAEATAAGALATHAADTTSVHGIADTSVLETQSGAQTKANAAQAAAEATAAGALATHAADTTAVHGIADTSVLETQAGAQAKADTAESNAEATAAAALAAHEADTTNVHGIPDTSQLATDADLAGYLPLTGGTVTGPITRVDTPDTDTAYAAQVTGEAFDRFRALISGRLEWGSGAATREIALYRTATGELTLLGTLRGIVAAAATLGYGVRVTGDTNDRFTVNGDGSMGWGPGNAGADVHVRRAGVNIFQVDDNLAVLGTTTLTGQLALAALLRITRPTAADSGFETRVTGDTNARFYSLADGKLHWGPGNAGADVTLYRAAADTLATDDNFQVAGQIAQTRPLTTSSVRDVRVTGDTQPRFYQVATGQMYWGPGNAALDTLLYRDQPGSLVTDGDFTVNGNLYATLATTITSTGVTAATNFTVQHQTLRNKGGVKFVSIGITTTNTLTTPGGTSGNITPDMQICTIPAAWRPPVDLYLAVSTGIGHGSIRVDTGGSCELLSWIPSQSVSAGSTFRFTYSFIT